MGDPAGIGPEVVSQALNDPAVRRLGKFIVIGDGEIFRRYGLRIPGDSLFVDLKTSFPRSWKVGKTDRLSGRCALAYLNHAIQLLKDKEINSLVTAPVSKEAIAFLRPSFHGHTEFLAEAFGAKHVDMMFVGEGIKTVIATRHIPISRVSHELSVKKIRDTIMLTGESLKEYFRIPRPRIAVCGLNPHAGEGGTIGSEEKDVIIPAIRNAVRRGIKAEGPFSADTLFYPPHLKGFDAVVAMYHDQGLIPVKSMYFKKLVNLTIGLSFIRTSPAHGTAFDIAGKNKADPSSMIEAIKLAIRLTR